ncbi:efflux RND transporter permease subunit [bacterium]|jgi:multidrug efflux pump subunit AcrB|nr:efflux RND transporter permease subunit [bacterium]
MDNQNLNNSTPQPKNKFDAEAIEKTRKGIFGFFITRTRLVILMLLAIIFGGALSLVNIPRESDPEVKIPIAVVTTIYPGASPLDIEDLITDEIENKLETLDDVKLITSNSMTGVSSITIEFEAEADLDDSISELKDKVNEINNLPDEAESPIVTPIRANDFPIITFSLAGDLSQEQLKQLGEIIQDDLENISGVSEVPLLGVSNREFLVKVNRESLNRLGLYLNNIVAAIGGSNMDMPLGSITIDHVDYNLRTISRFKSVEDLSKVVVGANGNSPILLSDVATIDDHLAELDTVSRISVAGQATKNTASLQIFKKTGGNILEIVDESKERVAQLKEDKIIPAGVTVELNNDYSQFIRNDLENLGTSGLQATVLIFIVMFLALSFKEATISLLAIPLTFLISIFYLNIRGYTLNSLTLFTLVLSLGLLVDTFIIILEGIFHNMRAGYNSLQSSLLSVAHYRKPLLAGIFTTISAFIPMLLVSGIMGEYLKVLPITISVTLISALFVSLVIVPSLAKVFLKRKRVEQAEKESVLEKYCTNKLRRTYIRVVNKFLANRKHKIKFTIAIVAAFIISLGLLIGGVIPVRMFPNVDVDFGFVNIEMPVGTDLEATEIVVRKVEDYLYERNDLKSFVTTIGQSSSFGFDRASSNEHLANISLTFVDVEDRDQKSYEIGQEIREDLEHIQEGKITVEEISGGPPTGAPIEIRVSGDDLIVLGELSKNIRQHLESVEGVINTSSNQKVSPADLTFTLDQEALARAGLSVAEVSGFLRTAIFGVTATEIPIGGDDIDVVVQLEQDSITSVEEIQNLSITNRMGQDVKLSRVADFSLEPALSTLRHRDFERTVTLRANVEPGANPSNIVSQVQDKMAAEIIPSGYDVKYGGEVEDIEQSFAELWNAMLIALLLIATILILQFNSFKTPLIILLTLPLMLIGVVIGMLVLHLPFSFSVFLGLISLAGIVVNDAIVLIDKTRRNIEEKNMYPKEAVVDAGDTRLQPILLTSITTIIGVAPLALSDEFWLGLSIAIIFGLAFATILQLFVIPMVFLQLEGKRLLKRRKQVNLN